MFHSTRLNKENTMLAKKARYYKENKCQLSIIYGICIHQNKCRVILESKVIIEKYLAKSGYFLVFAL